MYIRAISPVISSIWVDESINNYSNIDSLTLFNSPSLPFDAEITLPSLAAESVRSSA